MLLRMTLDSISHQPHPHGPAPQPGPVRNTDLIRISEVGAEYELASGGVDVLLFWESARLARRINRARSFSPGRSAGRVLPCYTTVAAGVDRSTPIARCPPPRVSSCPYPGVDGARRAYGATCRARIVCLAERDARDSDLSCVPNEKRPLPAVDAVISQRRVHLDRTNPFAAAVALWMGRHYQDVNPRRNCNHSVRRERGFNRRCTLRIMCYTGKSSRVLLVVY